MLEVGAYERTSLMTRHETLTHFDETHRWFHGPDFLQKRRRMAAGNCCENDSRRGGDHVTSTLVNKEDSQVVPNVSRFSSWTRLLAVRPEYCKLLICFGQTKS
ncbi:hypothetical protein EVAR_21268_1 [Eumeta japonica]|uniref:Uncharacterized protein n=1 Tax=Eumeta variegata TaxID=151549 RepID=A0A4C1WPV2_EUMVA|nr:hypothetical protein EVAR_21268_1 [Eumeta japonica]